jgi:hypothetical protein
MLSLSGFGLKVGGTSRICETAESAIVRSWQTRVGVLSRGVLSRKHVFGDISRFLLSCVAGLCAVARDPDLTRRRKEGMGSEPRMARMGEAWEQRGMEGTGNGRIASTP